MVSRWGRRGGDKDGTKGGTSRAWGADGGFGW